MVQQCAREAKNLNVFLASSYMLSVTGKNCMPAQILSEAKNSRKTLKLFSSRTTHCSQFIITLELASSMVRAALQQYFC